MPWAAQWRSENRIDGRRRHLIGTIGTEPKQPTDGHGRAMTALFLTRAECREWIERNFGYIREREDLRSEPHGWSLPVPVKVEIVETT